MTPGLQPRPRAEVRAWLKEMAERYEHTTDDLVKRWVADEMELREKGGLVCRKQK